MESTTERGAKASHSHEDYHPLQHQHQHQQQQYRYQQRQHPLLPKPHFPASALLVPELYQARGHQPRPDINTARYQHGLVSTTAREAGMSRQRFLPSISSCPSVQNGELGMKILSVRKLLQKAPSESLFKNFPRKTASKNFFYSFSRSCSKGVSNGCSKSSSGRCIHLASPSCEPVLLKTVPLPPDFSWRISTPSEVFVASFC